MQCTCGGATKEVKAKRGAYVLEFARCEGCGRIGSEKLYLSDTSEPFEDPVAFGTEARREYQALR